jgi:hypothetical protein
MQAFDDAGIRVYALSYDEQEALTDFADAYNITYTFLSDPKSEVIRHIGILNTIIAEDDQPWFGIPYPGTYLLDAEGTITHKFFENNLAVRVGPEQLLRAFRGDTLAEWEQPNLASAPTEVTAKVFLEGQTLALSVQRELVAQLTVPVGSHVYASPAPEGIVAVDIEVDANPLLVFRDIVRPPSETHSLSETAETFQVHHGQLVLRLPVTINGMVTGEERNNEIVIEGTVRWQSCDDEVCDLPGKHRFELTVPVEAPMIPQIRVPDDERTIEPRAGEHFQHMVNRHKQSL